MKIRFKIILHRNKLMFNILFRLIGMDKRETCPAHFWFYKGFVSCFHRNIEQLWLESTFLDYLAQLLINYSY